MNSSATHRTRITALILTLIIHAAFFIFILHSLRMNRRPFLFFNDNPLSSWVAHEINGSTIKTIITLKNDTPKKATNPTLQSALSDKAHITKKIVTEAAAAIEPIEKTTAEKNKLPNAQQEKQLPLSPSNNVVVSNTIASMKEEPIDPRSRIVKSQFVKNPLIKPEAPIKKKLTLAQIASDFSRYLENEKTRHDNDKMTTALSAQNGTPTQEQLMHEQYMEKISTLVNQSRIIHKNKAPYSKDNKPNMQIRLTLNRNGSIRNLEIIQSSGSLAIDEFMVFAFHDASSSFPPIPSYFTQDPYIFSISTGTVGI